MLRKIRHFSRINYVSGRRGVIGSSRPCRIIVDGGEMQCVGGGILSVQPRVDVIDAATREVCVSTYGFSGVSCNENGFDG